MHPHSRPEQAIQGPRVGPTNPFIEFKGEEIERSVPERFEKIVRLYPHRLAVKAGDRSLSYDALNQAANRIAHSIVEKRGTESEPIGLLFEHGIDVIVTILGALKAGKFYVVLNPSFPLERNAYIFEDSQAGMIVTNNRNLELAQKLTKDAFALLNIDEIDDSLSSDNLGLFLSQEALMNIRYTSGSTGKPKGIVQTHRQVMSFGVPGAADRQICQDDRLTLVHFVGFGSASSDLFQSLLNGASLFPFDVKSEGTHRLARWLEEERITVCHLPPALFRELAGGFSSQDKLPPLRLVSLSGAPITQVDFEFYKKKTYPGTLLEISMGSTEAGPICAAIVDQTFPFPKEGSPVGYPSRGKKVLLLDENGHGVEPSEVGQIAVKGRNLNPGYWRRPDLTRAKFLPDPNGGEERIYLTGDLGRMLPDGFLIYMGRKDSQVKIRGYRVEIAEIERALLAHSQVSEVGIVAWDREPGEKYLIAYVVPREKPGPSINELYDFLKKGLPDYMMPSAFMFLESLPLTNGKLDRTALLPVPDQIRPDLEGAFVAPRSPVEKELARIWSEVLKLEQVGIHDNFFDLGGHSLLATQVISRVINTFRVELPLRSLFEAPTIERMAVVITQNQAKKSGPEDLARMLTELESLSEEEAQQHLANEGASRQ